MINMIIDSDTMYCQHSIDTDDNDNNDDDDDDDYDVQKEEMPKTEAARSKVDPEPCIFLHTTLP